MEDTKKIITTERSEENTRGVTPGCPFWIFGSVQNAQKDLDKRIEIVDK